MTGSLFPGARPREPRTPRKPKVQESVNTGCTFVPDPNAGRDYSGLAVCVNCNRVGEPGDARHTLPDSPEQAEHRQRYDAEDGAA